MSTGTGIFLSGLIIGLVMLYGQTKDRWNWTTIVKNSIYVIFLLVFLIYQFLNDWKKPDIDYSFKGFIVGLVLWVWIFIISFVPMYLISTIYEVVSDRSFEYDDEGNERIIYKIVFWGCMVLVLLNYNYFGDSWREVVSVWYNKNFN
jgi:uncharacterized membrane protein